jgi:hypothetical protein
VIFEFRDVTAFRSISLRPGALPRRAQAKGTIIVAKKPSAFFGGSQPGTRPIVSRVNHDGKSARGYTFTPVTRGGDGKVITGEAVSLPYGTVVIADIGGILWGPHCYRPFNANYMVPYGQPIPVVPVDVQGEFSDHLAVPLLVKGHGLGQWLVGGVLAQNSLYSVWTRCQTAAEAAQGLIPVLALRPSLAVPIASRNGEISYQPVLEITGWVPRDAAIFGERTVPAPQARVGSEAPAVSGMLAKPVPVILPPEQVSLPPEQVAQPAPSTAPDPFASAAPVATPTAIPPAAPVPPAAITVPAPSAAPRF